VIADLAAKGRRLSGYIAETCPSVGGQIMLPKGFLADVYARVRAAGAAVVRSAAVMVVSVARPGAAMAIVSRSSRKEYLYIRMHNQSRL